MLLRFALIFVAVLLILDVIQHPSGTGNPACYTTCYHVSHHVKARH
jgi:hypothetical protein